jgi:uncharacterized repeat protein (TIGR01451 family)
MKRTKVWLSICIAITTAFLWAITVAAPAEQLDYDVELNTSWLDTYVNQSSILRYVINFLNKGTETANNVTINTTLPSYLRYIWSDAENITNTNTGIVYDDFDPCGIDFLNETGVYMTLFDAFAIENSFPTIYDLLLVEPELWPLFNTSPYNASPNMVWEFLWIEASGNGSQIRNVIYYISNIDIQQDYPQCWSEAVIGQSRDIGSLMSWIGWQITVYLQVLEDELQSTFTDHGTIHSNQTINYGLETDTINNGNIYSTYTNNSNTWVTSIFLTKAWVPELFSNQDMLDAIIDESMTEQQKAIAIRQFVKDNTLNYPNPSAEQWYAGALRPSLADYSDPVRALNTVYGMCGEINSTFLSLARMAGLTWRTIGLSGHIPAEVLIDGNRAYMDADGGVYWTDSNDGHIYSLDELAADPNIIRNDPQDNTYDTEYYISLIESTGDNEILSEYTLTPAASYTMALQLYPDDVISYGTYAIYGQGYGEGTIKRILNPNYAITDITADSFVFHESLPYLIINTYIDSDGSIPDDVSVYLTRGTGNVNPEIALWYLHERLGYSINTSDRLDNYYDYSLRFKCQSACDIQEVISKITVTSSFTYNSLVLAHDGSVDLNILAADPSFAWIDVATEYNTNNQISLTTTLSGDQDDIILNNDKTITLNAIYDNPIILPASGWLLQNIMLHRWYTTNDPGSFFTQAGRLTRGVYLDFYNTFTIAENIIFSSDDGRVQVFLPEGLIFTPSESCQGGNGWLERPEYFSLSEAIEEIDWFNQWDSWLTEGTGKVILVNYTCENISLELSQPVKIRIYINDVLGDIVSARASSDRWVTRETIPATRISDHIIEIETTHFSLFTASSTNSTPTPSGWGGGGWSTPKDNCPTGDFSPSYYDGVCGTPTTPTTVENTWTVTVTGTTNTCNVSNELALAYDLAFDLGITSATDVCQADMYGPVLRKYLAKFLTVYATKVLGMKPDTTRTCTFSDVNNESTEMQFYMKIACQLGLMGLEQDGTPATIFNPNELVNRAQFGTVFSRLIFGPKYNIPMTDSRPRYQNHLNILKRTTIMDKIDEPYIVELRGYVMLMMMKAKTLLKK